MVAALTAQRLITRDFIAWLVGKVAAGQPNPEKLLRNISEAEDRRIDMRRAEGPRMMKLAETMREEKDWILTQARNVMTARKGRKSS